MTVKQLKLANTLNTSLLVKEGEKMDQLSQETLKKIFQALANSLNVSDTTTQEIISSYEAVGNYLGNLEEDLDIKIFPQGSMALGTMIKPLSSDKNGEYDVDLVCQLTNGEHLCEAEVKQIVGKRLKESSRYSQMMDPEGKRCWTLNYAGFHMDILPCTPVLSAGISTAIRITEKKDKDLYEEGISDPKGYLEWFTRKMRNTYTDALQNYAELRKVNVEKIRLYNLRTPLQMAIQILKRHRDIMFEGKKHRPASIIINTLAARAYNGENNVYDAVCNIIKNMENSITKNECGELQVLNPTLRQENFADRWITEPKRQDAFFNWLRKAKKDIVEDPLNFIDGLDSLKNRMTENFGFQVIQDTFEAYGNTIQDNRIKGKLGVDPRGHITSAKGAAIVPVKNHTFFGSD